MAVPHSSRSHLGFPGVLEPGGLRLSRKRPDLIRVPFHLIEFLEFAMARPVRKNVFRLSSFGSTSLRTREPDSVSVGTYSAAARLR